MKRRDRPYYFLEVFYHDVSYTFRYWFHHKIIKSLFHLEVDYRRYGGEYGEILIIIYGKSSCEI